MRICHDEEDLKVKYVSLHTLDAPAPPLDRLVVVTPPLPKTAACRKTAWKRRRWETDSASEAPLPMPRLDELEAGVHDDVI